MKPILLRNFLITLLISQVCGISICQVPVSSENNRLSAGFYKDRRDALRKIMPPNSVFVLFASPERTLEWQDVTVNVYGINFSNFNFSTEGNLYNLYYWIIFSLPFHQEGNLHFQISL